MTDPTTHGHPADHVVTVTREQDDVRISATRTPAAPSLRSALDAAGGLLTFDVTDLSAAPSILLTDLAAASGWIGQVFGEDTSEAVEAVARDGEVRAVAFAPTATTRALARLAWGSWLHRWWPIEPGVTTLDADVLSVELAALAWQNDRVFLDRQPAGSILTGSDIPAAIVRVLDAGDHDDTAIAATQAAIELWDLDEPARAEIEELADVLSGGDETTRARVLARLREPRVHVGVQGDYELTADIPGHDPTHEVVISSVDWTQVPPRVLDWSEDTISADLSGRDLFVEVASAVEPAPPTTLFARVYRVVESGSALPIALFALQPTVSAYAGRARLDEDVALAELAVDVYAPRHVRPPRIDPGQAERIRDDREAARTVILDRSDRVRRERAGDLTDEDPTTALFLGEGS